jgi:hypothetical protein
MIFENHVSFFEETVKFIYILLKVKTEDYISWDDELGRDKSIIITTILSGLLVKHLKQDISRMVASEKEIEDYVDGLLLRMKKGIIT